MSGQRSYIVYGETGEHSDHQEWPVVTYSVSMAADAHVDLATAWARSHGFADYGHGRWPAPGENPWDPGMKVDYNGVSYFVKSVPARISSVRPIR